MPEEHSAFVAVGANLDPEEHIAEALTLLCRQVKVEAVSTFYRTLPVARSDQPSFMNGVWRIVCSVEPIALKFNVLRRIETALGRNRSMDRHSARPIDLDLILFDNVVSDTDELRLPDPDIRKRWFVAVPLLELSPKLVLPDTEERLCELSVASTAEPGTADRAFTARLNRMINR